MPWKKFTNIWMNEYICLKIFEYIRISKYSSHTGWPVMTWDPYCTPPEVSSIANILPYVLSQVPIILIVKKIINPSNVSLTIIPYTGTGTGTGLHKWGGAHQTSKHLPNPNL